MASVSGCLFEQVHEYPSEIYRRLISHISAQFVEARGCRHNLVSALPGVLVNVNGALYRVVRVYRVIRDLNVLTGEAAQDPKRFHARHVLHEPKKGRTTSNVSSPGGIVVDSNGLPDKRSTLVLKQRLQRPPLVAIESRRLLVMHHQSVRPRATRPIRKVSSVGASFP